MTSVCLYFQVHQPPRLRRYSVFDTGHDYFDDDANRAILRKVAHKCYIPTTRLLIELANRYPGDFRVAFSLTGSVIEQMRDYNPEALECFQELAETGAVEFLAETYHHSLAGLYSPSEFVDQINLHVDLIDETFGQTPSVFRNTELIYNNDLAGMVDELGHYRGILAEGVDRLLDGRPTTSLYTPPGRDHFAVMLKNYGLSDDIAFRFSDQNWGEYPLTAEKYADWIHALGERNGHIGNEPQAVCNLFMDYETFGEHQWEETGIFAFLRSLPDQVFARGDGFKTPGECIDQFEPTGDYDAPDVTSWADSERDLSAWVGNAMQSSALDELYKLEDSVKTTGDPRLLRDWRRLTCSDHFYYMCTKYFADAAVHNYFNPYESPYDSYINYMNVLDNLRGRAG